MRRELDPTWQGFVVWRNSRPSKCLRLKSPHSSFFSCRKIIACSAVFGFQKFHTFIILFTNRTNQRFHCSRQWGRRIHLEDLGKLHFTYFTFRLTIFFHFWVSSLKNFTNFTIISIISRKFSNFLIFFSKLTTTNERKQNRTTTMWKVWFRAPIISSQNLQHWTPDFSALLLKKSYTQNTPVWFFLYTKPALFQMTETIAKLQKFG